MSIEFKDLFELVAIVTIVKLVVVQWKPPLQKSLCALISIVLGIMIGVFLNPTKEGFVTAIISSGLGFYGGELMQAFKTTRKEFYEKE